MRPLRTEPTRRAVLDIDAPAPVMRKRWSAGKPIDNAVSASKFENCSPVQSGTDDVLSLQGEAMAEAFRRSGLTAARSLMMTQAIACLAVGIVLVVAPSLTVATLAVVLAVYWLVRGVCTVLHTLVVAPHQWGGRGLVAVLVLVASMMILQAPLAGAFVIGMAIALFAGVQCLVAGSIELVLADRSAHHAVAFLALANVALGLGLVIPSIAGVAVPAVAIGTGIAFCGLLAIYCVIELPPPRPRTGTWLLTP